MISEAYIAGQIHQAVIKNDEGYCMVRHVEGNAFRWAPIHHFDLNAFLLTRPEIEHFKDIEWTDDQLQNILNKHIARYDALDFFLVGMDTAYHPELRKKAITLLADDYYDNAENGNFIINRVLGTSLPSGFDPLPAALLAHEINHKELQQLYTNLSYAGDIIIAIRHSWKEAVVKDEPLLKNISLAQLDKVFTDDGLFAGFVTAVLEHDSNAFDNVIIANSKRLEKIGISQPAIFLTDIKMFFQHQYPLKLESISGNEFEEENIEETQPDFETQFNDLIDNFSGKTKKKKSIKEGEKEKLPELVGFFEENNIPQQIDWIKNQILNRNALSAEGGILKLIEFQDVNSDPHHLCKSLCVIAQCYQENGEVKMADLLAHRAIDLNPKDAVPHCILAENLRTAGRLEEVLKLYNETIKKFGNDVFAYCGKAETLRELGRSDEALKLYNETIEKFGNNVIARCGKAETLRELGRSDEALNLYNQTIKQSNNNQVAKNGRFTILVQIGENLTELEKEIKISNPVTHQDWIQYHLHSMLLIKLHRIEEAVTQLKYGVKNASIRLDKLYFKSALTYAYIKKKNYQAAIYELKQTDFNQPISKILAAHALGAERKIQESQKYLSEILKSPDKKVKEVSHYLSDRFHLNKYVFHKNRTPHELDVQIDNLEVALLTRISSLKMAA